MPTRLGYVVRCSSTQALYKENSTYLKAHGKLLELEPPTHEGVAEVKRLYAEENLTDNVIRYNHPIMFSMNRGDYSKPHYQAVDEFRWIAVDLPTNPFEELLASVQFEDVGKGRQGAVLVKPGSRGVPIVRTTSKYNNPAHCFQDVHERLAQKIQQSASLPPNSFNNALIENYSNAYTTMGFHSDQALDLEPGTSIAVFSCYKHPELANPPRKLVVQSKDPNGASFDIPLSHNSAVVFSLDTNQRHKHKIILDTAGRQLPDNQWLGVTFRSSKTFMQYHDEEDESIEGGGAFFEDGTRLAMATGQQGGEFYKLRGRENRETDFSYPDGLAWTLSKSDTMPPIGDASVCNQQ